MKYLYLFAIGILVGAGVHAATGTGHAQTELAQPLSITTIQDIDFGVIAKDGVGIKYLSIRADEDVLASCPSGYICSGNVQRGVIQISGPANTPVYGRVLQNATLSNGGGITLHMPVAVHMNYQSEFYATLDDQGKLDVGIGAASMGIPNDAEGGVYSTQNPGGQPYVISVVFD